MNKEEIKMEKVLIEFFREASSYQSIDPTCFDLQEFTETWLENNKKQFSLQGVVKSLKGKKAMSFGVWKMKCKDIEYIEYIDRKLVKYKGNLMSYEELEKEYHKIKHTL